MSSPHLRAASAAWDDAPRAGEWIEPLLGPFGPRLGHAVPQVYAAYAVVPIPQLDDDPDAGDVQDDYSTLAALLDVLDPFTGDQAVHVGLWEGWGSMYDPGEDPRTAPGMAAAFTLGRRRRFAFTARARRERAGDDAALAAARERIAELRVQRPAAAPLDLPARRYYLWTGPLRSALALRQAVNLPSLVWPDDRSWFVGAPIYTREIAVGGPAEVIRAVLDDERLAAHGARSARPDDVLDIDD